MKYKQFLIAIFLLLILTLSGCVFTRSTIHPSLMESPEAPRGYVEFFVPAKVFGTTDPNIRFYEISVGEYKLEKLFAPQYPFQSTDFSLASSLFYTRATLPPGEHEINFALGDHVTPYKLTIYKDRLTVVRLESDIVDIVRLKKSKALVSFYPIKVFVANTTLPKPKDIGVISAEADSLDSLIQILSDDDWGLRDYAALRIKLIGYSRALPALEEAYSKEKNEAVKKTISDAIKSLK
jgi:hypothetical protein